MQLTNTQLATVEAIAKARAIKALVQAGNAMNMDVTELIDELNAD